MLASTKTDDLTVESIAHTVGLSIFECNSCNSQIALGVFRQRSRVLRHDDGVEGVRWDNLGVVAVLL